MDSMWCKRINTKTEGKKRRSELLSGRVWAVCMDKKFEWSKAFKLVNFMDCESQVFTQLNAKWL